MPPIPTAPDSWNERHLPVLLSAVARFEAGEDVHGSHIADDTELTQDVVDRTARELRSMGYLDVRFSSEGFWVEELSIEARRIAGAWPTPESFAERLIAAVEQGLAAAKTDDERSRWRKLLDGLTSAGRDVVVNASGSALGTAAIGG